MSSSTTVEPQSRPQSAAGSRRCGNSGSLLYDMRAVLSLETWLVTCALAHTALQTGHSRAEFTYILHTRKVELKRRDFYVNTHKIIRNCKHHHFAATKPSGKNRTNDTEGGQMSRSPQQIGFLETGETRDVGPTNSAFKHKTRSVQM